MKATKISFLPFSILLLGLLTFSTASVKAQSLNWTRDALYNIGEEIATLGVFASIAIYNNIPHVSYTSTRVTHPRFLLHYATTNNKGEWRNEIVATNDDGYFLSSKIGADAGNRVAITYSVNGKLWLAIKRDAEWDREIVNDNASVSTDQDLSLYAGRVYISYYDRDRRDLLYSTRQISQYQPDWIHETVRSTGDVGAHNSIDGAIEPRISYVDMTRNRLMYSVRGSQNWHTEIVRLNVPVENTSIVEPSSGEYNIFYSENGTLYRAVQDYVLGEGFRWKFPAVRRLGGGTGLLAEELHCSGFLKASNQKSKPCVLYQDGNNIKFIRLSPGDANWTHDENIIIWVNETITEGTAEGFATDDEGMPHVLFTKNGHLRYTKLNLKKNEDVLNISLIIKTANVEDAGTDDAVSVSLNSKDTVWLDLAKDDRERGQVDKYVLPIDRFNIKKITDIKFIRITKPPRIGFGIASDGWKIEELTLEVNGKAIFVNESIPWLDNETEPSIYFKDLDYNPQRFWVHYLPPAPKFFIKKSDLQSSIEVIVGDALHKDDADWCNFHGAPVELSKKDNNTISCNLDLCRPVDILQDPDVDVNFDISFHCDDKTINVDIENIRVSVDTPLTTEILTFGLGSPVAWLLLRYGIEPLLERLAQLSIEVSLSENERKIHTPICPTIDIRENLDVHFSFFGLEKFR